MDRHEEFRIRIETICAVFTGAFLAQREYLAAALFAAAFVAIQWWRHVDEQNRKALTSTQSQHTTVISYNPPIDREAVRQAALEFQRRQE